MVNTWACDGDMYTANSNSVLIRRATKTSLIGYCSAAHPVSLELPAIDLFCLHRKKATKTIQKTTVDLDVKPERRTFQSSLQVRDHSNRNAQAVSASFAPVVRPARIFTHPYIRSSTCINTCSIDQLRPYQNLYCICIDIHQSVTLLFHVPYSTHLHDN